jgi:hypothetical protein
MKRREFIAGLCGARRWRCGRSSAQTFVTRCGRRLCIAAFKTKQALTPPRPLTLEGSSTRRNRFHN